MSSEFGKLMLSSLMALLIVIAVVAAACLFKKLYDKYKKNKTSSSDASSAQAPAFDRAEELHTLLPERAVWTKLYIDTIIQHSTKAHSDSLHAKIAHNSEELSSYLRNYLDAQNTAAVNELLSEQLDLITAISSKACVDEEITEQTQDLMDNGDDLAKILVSVHPNMLSFDKIKLLLQKQNDYLMDQIKSGVSRAWNKNVDSFQKYYDTTVKLANEF